MKDVDVFFSTGDKCCFRGAVVDKK